MDVINLFVHAVQSTVCTRHTLLTDQIALVVATCCNDVISLFVAKHWYQFFPFYF